jgi:hypothetical protein
MIGVCCLCRGRDHASVVYAKITGPRSRSDKEAGQLSAKPRKPPRTAHAACLLGQLQPATTLSKQSGRTVPVAFDGRLDHQSLPTSRTDVGGVRRRRAAGRGVLAAAGSAVGSEIFEIKHCGSPDILPPQSIGGNHGPTVPCQKRTQRRTPPTMP